MASNYVHTGMGNAVMGQKNRPAEQRTGRAG